MIFFNITLEVEVEVILKGNSMVLLQLVKKKKILEGLLLMVSEIHEFVLTFQTLNGN